MILKQLTARSTSTKHTVRMVLGLAIVYAIGVLAPSKAAAHPLPNTAKLLPPDTVLLVNVRDFSQLKQQLKKTDLYKLYKDPAMAAFVEDFKAKFREHVKDDANKTTKQIAAIARIIADPDLSPQGRVAVAALLNQQAERADEPQVLLIAECGDNLSKVREELEKASSKAVENGAHLKTDEYRGVRITTRIRESSQDMSYCFIDDCLTAATNLELLKFAVAHLKGAGGQTLADDPDYANALAAVGPHHDIDFYINIKQLISTATPEDSTDKRKEMMAALGLDDVTTFCGAVGLGRTPGCSVAAKALLKINAPKKGIFKILELESAVLKAPKFIAASAYSVAFLNVNIAKAYDELYKILHSFSPKHAAIMQMPLLLPGPQGQLALELKRDVIDHLGTQIISARSMIKPPPTDSKPTQSLIAVSVANGSALEESLSRWHNTMIAPYNPDARRELLGHTIYLLKASGVPFFTHAAFTITDTHLVIGSEQTVEQAIRTLSSSEVVSLDSRKWFADAKAAIPSVVGLAGLEDNAASSEFVWSKLKQAPKSTESESSTSISISLSSESLFPQIVLSQTCSKLFDFTLLPEFDEVRKYFGLSILHAVSTPEGFLFELKHLNPPATN